MTKHIDRSIRPEALLLVATQCPHCHALQHLLQNAQSEELISGLKVINIETDPELASEFHVRSVPWLRLGQLEFSGDMTATELDQFIKQAMQQLNAQDMLENMLLNGKLMDVVNAIRADKFTLSDLIPLLEKQDAKINVRIGTGAVLEHFEDTDQIRSILPMLVELTRHKSSIVRADACHYLTLTHSPEVEEAIKALLNDEDAEVREIAHESLEHE